MGENVNLTPTMLNGLRKMALNLMRQSVTLAEPNENTGRALAKRGLIELADNGPRNGWNYYVLTHAGRAVVEEVEARP